eukprot:CAMPEP_0175080930 /NCGR_PEP_ID=MMETSP0052_2-20121109/25824_1 /TAXON_ID=51329 ORGANISM="Polytomella parva, Strain SAG 63-3" /NCGR_SAMPLE_ID=MMETSP0052_2 /ASSEMBLY_ACC=CAM_ASM_000194 /LENGTH=631 /DNA_ID=CAMNT_0016351771 /DNA_START=468 /DNA_END=2363 /DNA_ORIENTATION=-
MTITASTSTVSLLSSISHLGPTWSTLINALNLNGSSAGVNISGKYYQMQSQFPGNGPCYAASLSSDEFLNRCYPQITQNVTAALVENVGNSAISALGANSTAGSYLKKLMNGGFRWSQYVSDLSRGIMIICVGGLAGGVVLSLIWMMFMRYFAGLFAWLTLLAANLMAIAVTLFCWVEAGYIGNSSIQDKINDEIPGQINPAHLSTRTWLWISIGASIVAAIVLIFTLLASSRLRVAIACIQVASQSLRSIPSLLLFPFLPYILTCGLVVYWVAVSGMLYSAGTLTAHCSSASAIASVSYAALANVSNVDLRNLSASSIASSAHTTYKCYTNLTESEMAYECGRDPACYLNYDWDRKMMYVFIYHFFGLLWTHQVIVGFSCVVIAGAVGSHYWSGGDSKLMPYFPLLTSLKNAFIFHLGSVVLGAFFIAIFQLIRYILEYIDNKSRQLQNASPIVRAIMCLFKCVLWCIEKIVSFINRNAYVIIGVRGSNYCYSVCIAVKLIVTNAMRIATVNIIGDLILFLGKLAIAASCGFIAFCLSELSYFNNATRYPSTQLSSPVMPVALSIIVGYFAAEVFFSVFEMAIDTVMLCFCEDCDMHDGNPKYAPRLLMEAVGMTPNQHPDDYVVPAKAK